MRKLLSLCLFAALAAQASTVDITTFGGLGNNSADNSNFMKNAIAAAGSGGTVNFPGSSSSVYLFNTPNSLNGAPSAVAITQPVTITCAPGVTLKTTNTSQIGYIFAVGSSNVTIGGSSSTGCVFDSAGIDVDGTALPNTAFSNVTVSYNTIQNVTSDTASGLAGIAENGLATNLHIDHNWLYNIWHNGYTTTLGTLFPTGCSATEFGCDIGPEGIAIGGMLIGGSIDHNKLQRIAADAIDFPGYAWYAYCSSLNTGSNFGYFEVAGNEIIDSHKMAIETGASAGCPNPNYSARVWTNVTFRSNYVHGQSPYTYWNQYGFSLPMNGTQGLQVLNNAAIMDDTTCFGNHDGIGLELAANTMLVQGNAVRANANNGCTQPGWTGYYVLGQIDGFSDTNIAPYAKFYNNVSCGPGASGGAGNNTGGVGNEGNYPPNIIPPVQLYANSFAETCANTNLTQSTMTAAFISASGRTISGSTNAFQVGFASNLPIDNTSFFLDGAGSPISTQIISDLNGSFPANGWLYSTNVDATGLAAGTHVLTATATDVSGGTFCVSQTFTVGSGGSFSASAPSSCPSVTAGGSGSGSTPPTTTVSNTPPPGAGLSGTPKTAAWPTRAATSADLFVAADQAATTLTGAMTSSSTSAAVATSSIFAVNQVVLIDAEQMQITAITGNTLTVTRAIAGTTAATHASGVSARGVESAVYHNQIAAELIALEGAAFGHAGSTIGTPPAYSGTAWPNHAATAADLYTQADFSASTLSSAINSSTLTIPLASATLFTAHEIITIDTEEIPVCSIATNTITACSRGFNGSAAASHSSGVNVYGLILGVYHNVLARELVALEADLFSTLGGGTASGGASWPNHAATVNELLGGAADGPLTAAHHNRLATELSALEASLLGRVP